mmetsp:Transcript_25059/g.46813  ORF Transcript_25059/g.46813 Transcript_25059/m.46813 type:complete len:323 (+) Transcript_25059:60-1028(+)
MTTIRVIKSLDGVSIAAHELLRASKTSTRIVFSHATGFHGRMFNKTMDILSPDFNCLAVDHRGHGLTKYAEDKNGQDSWEMFGDDLVAACSAFKDPAQGNNSIIGVGHSMGASAFLIAALKDPSLFRALVLYEPIIFPPHLVQPYSVDMKDTPLAVQARRRRNSFSSFTAAFENFTSKPPFKSFDRDVVLDFVRYGMVTPALKGLKVSAYVNDASIGASTSQIDSSTDEDIVLRCSPEFEAFVYNSVSAYYLYDKILSITDIPVLIVSGESVANEPSSWADDITSRIPGAQLQRWQDAGHFGPFERPDRFAEVLRTVATGNC